MIKHLSFTSPVSMASAGTVLVDAGASIVSSIRGTVHKGHSLFGEWQKRRELYKLLDADEAQLHDMNITKADVRHALRLPLTINAGRILERVRRGY